MNTNYETARNEYPDALIGVPVSGNFEFYGDHAKAVADALELTMTEGDQALICSFPAHQVENCLPVLADRGFEVALLAGTGSAELFAYVSPNESPIPQPVETPAVEEVSSAVADQLKELPQEDAPLPMLPQVPSAIPFLSKVMLEVLENIQPDFSIKDPELIEKSLHKCRRQGLVDFDQTWTLNWRGQSLYAEWLCFQSGLAASQLPEWAKPALKVRVSEPNKGWLTNIVNGNEWFSNTHFMLKGAPEGKRDSATPNFQRVADGASAAIVRDLGRPVAYFSDRQHGTIAVFSNGTTVRNEYLQFMEQAFPNAKWVTNQTENPCRKPICMIFEGEFVGVLMPMTSDIPAGAAKAIAESQAEPVPFKYSKKRTKTVKQENLQPQAVAVVPVAVVPPLKAVTPANVGPKQRRPLNADLPSDAKDQARKLILEGKGPSEVKKLIGCRHDFAAKILAEELAKLGSAYSVTLRIVSGKVVSASEIAINAVAA